MTKKIFYESQTEELLLPLLAEFGFEFVDVEYVKEGDDWHLRAYIDKEGGITLNDCAAVSRRMSDLLDEKNFIDASYIFEVSSPGLDRPLKKERDYDRAMGKNLEIHTYRLFDGKKEFFGILKDYTEDAVLIASEGGKEFKFDKKDIALIRLALEL